MVKSFNPSQHTQFFFFQMAQPKRHTDTQIIASSNWLLVAQVLQLIAAYNKEEILPRS
jgi:hypothetical protein